jgi:hypothetical protein
MAPSPVGSRQARQQQVVSTDPRDHGLLYGLVTAMMALATGWLASVAFRRD